MASQALPILLAAGAAIALSGKKKKKRKSAKSGDKCDPALAPPKGFLCEEGFLKEEAIDESDLDSDADLSKEDAGEFDEDEMDVSPGEDEEAIDPEAEPPSMGEPEPDPVQTCEEFMQALHVTPVDPGELPINDVAVQETVIPTMEKVANAVLDQIGPPIDPETVGPMLVLESLKALIPVCTWKYDAQEDEFTYDGGMPLESQAAKDVLYGLIKISMEVIDQANGVQQKNFQPNEGQESQFNPGG